MKKLLIVTLILCCSLASAEDPFHSILVQAGEVELVKRLAPRFKAEAEVRLPDGTRVDLLNSEYAMEADWSHKWAEAIGQSTYYGLMTGRKPAIILLIRDRKDEFRHIIRCRAICHHLSIRLILIDTKDIKETADGTK